MKPGSLGTKREFNARVKRTIKRIWGEKSNPQRQFLIDSINSKNSRVLDIENLYRMAKERPEHADKIIEDCLAKLSDPSALRSVQERTWEEAKEHIFPRVRPISIFNSLNRDDVPHIPFVNDTVIIFEHDLPEMTSSITMNKLRKWGVKPKALEKIAIKNLQQRKAEIQFVLSKEGGRSAVIQMDDGYDSSRLLSPNVLREISKGFGTKTFIAAIPTRDMILFMTADTAALVERMRDIIQNRYYKNLPYPITPNPFLVTVNAKPHIKPRVKSTSWADVLARITEQPTAAPSPTPQ